jgi:CheY-like chemotaxis protein
MDGDAEKMDEFQDSQTERFQESKNKQLQKKHLQRDVRSPTNNNYRNTRPMQSEDIEQQNGSQLYQRLEDDPGKADDKVASFSCAKLSPILKVLIVDDSATNRKMLCKLLAKENALCDTAEDGLVAVNMVRNLFKKDILFSFRNEVDGGEAAEREVEEQRRGYDVILMDYTMPNMDGPTAIKAIRKMGFHAAIIGVTGHGDQADRDAMLSAGADDVLIKPVDWDAFWSVLQSCRRKRESSSPRHRDG